MTGILWQVLGRSICAVLGHSENCALFARELGDLGEDEGDQARLAGESYLHRLNPLLTHEQISLRFLGPR